MCIYYKGSTRSMYVQLFDIDHGRLVGGCSVNIWIRKCGSLNANARSLLGRSDCAFTYLSLHVESRGTSAEAAFDSSNRRAEFQKKVQMCVFPVRFNVFVCIDLCPEAASV